MLETHPCTAGRCSSEATTHTSDLDCRRHGGSPSEYLAASHRETGQDPLMTDDGDDELALS